MCANAWDRRFCRLRASATEVCLVVGLLDAGVSARVVVPESSFSPYGAPGRFRLSRLREWSCMFLCSGRQGLKWSWQVTPAN